MKNPKTKEITRDEWLALLEIEDIHVMTPPPGSKTVSELAALANIGTDHMHRRLRKLRREGKWSTVLCNQRGYWFPVKNQSKKN